MDPEQADRLRRHIEPTDSCIPEKFSDDEICQDPTVHRPSPFPPRSPPIREGSSESSEEADVGQLEPADAGSSLEEANVGQLEPADAGGSPEEAVVGQLEPADAGGSTEANVVQLETADAGSSLEEANAVQLEPADARGLPEEANAVQLESADVDGSAEKNDVAKLEQAHIEGSGEGNVVQLVSSDEEGSRASPMEVDGPDPRANEDGALAEEPRRMNFEDIRRRVLAGPPNPPLEDNVPQILQALLGEGEDRLERAAAVEEWMAAAQMAIANLRRGADALEAAAANFRDAMVAMEAGFGARRRADHDPAADPA